MRHVLRRALCTLLFAIAVPGAGAAQIGPPARAQADTVKSVYNFILNYDVPESPGFVALGVAPSNVVRGAAGKPIVVNLLADIIETRRVGSGIAIDLSPMVFARRTFSSFNDYRNSLEGRILRRTSLSFATVRPDGDTTSLRLATGLRFNFSDVNDPLSADTAFFNSINRLLLAEVTAPGVVLPGQAAGIGAPVRLRDPDAMAALYRMARDSALARTGWAFSAAWAWAAMVHGAVIERDSIRDGEHHLWLAGRYKFGTPASFLFTASWQDVGGERDALIGGVALRAELPTASVAGEVAYDFASGRVRPGANAEISALPGARIIVGLVSQEDPTQPDQQTRLKLITSIKWNLGEALKR